MRFHDELNPKLWQGFELKEEVKDKLEEITEAFIEYLDIPAESILDVQITGSSANYNYTEHSDLDLHLIVDYEKVHQECPIVEGYLWSMKSTFNKEHDISIYGVPVEVYAEDSRQSAVSNGVYSLLNDEWIKKPEKIEPTTNDAAVLAKYNEIKDIVDKLNDSEEAEEILNKVYEMRKAGLAAAGEFSTENLAFKMLRNEGYIDMLKKIKKEKIDKQLTLESYDEYNDRSDKFMSASKNESVNESTKKYRSVVADDKYTRLRDLYGRRGRKRTLHVKPTGETKQFLSGPKKEYKDIKTGELFYLGDNTDVMTDIMGEPYTKFEIIRESFEKPLDKEEFACTSVCNEADRLKELNERLEQLLEDK